jgi:hypothetical protein
MRTTGLLLGVMIAAGAVGAQDPPPGWVTLSVAEYQQLRGRAYPELEPDPPPVEATVSRVEYDLRVATDSAEGMARLFVDVLKEGWVKVPTPSGLRVREARIDGRPVALVGGPEAPALLLSKAGRHDLHLSVAVPLSTGPGSESLALPASPAAVSRATLVVPRNGLDLAVHGGVLVEKAESAPEGRYVAYGRAGEALRFTWRRKTDDQRARLPLKLRGHLTSLVGLTEDAAQVSAHVRVEVLQGSTRSLALALPEGLAVNQVTGPLVADWDVKPGLLTVALLEPVEHEAAFVVAAEARATRDGRLKVPILRLPAAERETGGLAVEVLGAGEITGREARGLDAADAHDLGEPVAGRDSPSLVAFRYRPQDGRSARQLEVDVTRYDPQALLLANVEEARYQALLTGDGKALVRGHYSVRNNQRSFLSVRLPAGAHLWSAAVGGQPVRPGQSQEGALLLPLEKGRAGEEAPAFVAEVVYFWRGEGWPEKGRASVPLPALDLPVSRTGLELRYPPQFRLSTEPGAFREAAWPGPLVADLGADGFALASPARAKEDKAPANAEVQGLLDQLSREGRGRLVKGTLPLRVPFTGIGAALYLTTELTPELEAPRVAFQFRRGGAR